jgi:hypothetical protein
VAAAALFAACDRQQGNPAQTSSTYTSDADSDATENARQGTPQGRTLEAPPKIPGLRVQLEQLRTGGAPSESNLTAYKNALADVVTSMRADLNRLGVTDSDLIREQGDSLLNQLGGGTGEAGDMSPERVRAHTHSVERLIRTYEGLVNRR